MNSVHPKPINMHLCTAMSLETDPMIHQTGTLYDPFVDYMVKIALVPR